MRATRHSTRVTDSTWEQTVDFGRMYSSIYPVTRNRRLDRASFRNHVIPFIHARGESAELPSFLQT